MIHSIERRGKIELNSKRAMERLFIEAVIYICNEPHEWIEGASSNAISRLDVLEHTFRLYVVDESIDDYSLSELAKARSQCNRAMA